MQGEGRGCMERGGDVGRGEGVQGEEGVQGDGRGCRKRRGGAGRGEGV